jgi:hypothetical protein
MKKALVVLGAGLLALVGCGAGATSQDAPSSDSDVTSDTCRKPALDAAEREYGNAPETTKVEAETKGKQYRVTVGIGNAEDGPHDYLVEFPAGCSSTPKVSDASDPASDACTKPALDAAEREYGNAPETTKVAALTEGKRYRVTVGIGNEEDGPHDYFVDFPAGCSSTPKVSEVQLLKKNDVCSADGENVGDCPTGTTCQPSREEDGIVSRCF